MIVQAVQLTSGRIEAKAQAKKAYAQIDEKIVELKSAMHAALAAAPKMADEAVDKIQRSKNSEKAQMRLLKNGWFQWNKACRAALSAVLTAQDEWLDRQAKWVYVQTMQLAVA